MGTDLFGRSANPPQTFSRSEFYKQAVRSLAGREEVSFSFALQLHHPEPAPPIPEINAPQHNAGCATASRPAPLQLSCVRIQGTPPRIAKHRPAGGG